MQQQERGLVAEQGVSLGNEAVRRPHVTEGGVDETGSVENPIAGQIVLRFVVGEAVDDQVIQDPHFRGIRGVPGHLGVCSFDQGIGDVFVGPVAVNFVNVDLLGSMEFACKVAGAKLILVLGHQHCGAIKGAIDNVKLGNITVMLSKIKPAVAASQDFQGEKTSSNPEFMKRINENNIRHTLSRIRQESPILKEVEDKDQIKIVGAFYRLTEGTLELIQ